MFAYLDDLYLVCRPERVGEVHAILRHHLWESARISIHEGKTKVWNRCGTRPQGCDDLQAAAESVLPGAVVWRGDHSLPTAQQGFKVLGVSFGHQDFVHQFLQTKVDNHSVLLTEYQQFQMFKRLGSFFPSVPQHVPISS